MLSNYVMNLEQKFYIMLLYISLYIQKAYIGLLNLIYWPCLPGQGYLLCSDSLYSIVA